MNGGPAYTDYHPRWLRTRMSTWWWLGKWPYLRFIMRELSSVFVAWFVLYFLLLIRAIGQGAPAYQGFLDWSARPLLIVLNAVSLLFVVYHAVTWFNLAPTAVAVRVRGERVPPFWIAAPNFLLWAVVSIVLVWLLVGAR